VARSLREGEARDPDAEVEHGVWEEPALSPELAGSAPPDQITYSRWLEEGRARTDAAWSWMVTAGVALVAGPWAILGAFMGSGGHSLFWIVTVVAVAPVVEETMKIAAATYVIEKRPYLFTSRAQILICALSAGLVFAAIENVLYLTMHRARNPELFAMWRWTVCTALHMGCSLVASLGLAKVWRGVWETMSRPRLTLGFPYLLAAVIIHGGYNGLVTLLGIIGLRF
jgi:hypothetical protein